jgi:hypothetical protein
MSVVECTTELEVGQAARSIIGIVVGRLIGFAGEGRTPLVTFGEQQGTAAVAAQSVVDLHADHIGREVVLMFDRGDPRYPIVMGWLRHEESSSFPDSRGAIEVDLDGERLIVEGKEQVVLRCGKASITLTKAGKVLIQGAYVLTHASGVNRIKGGSVQLN